MPFYCLWFYSIKGLSSGLCPSLVAFLRLVTTSHERNCVMILCPFCDDSSKRRKELRAPSEVEAFYPMSTARQSGQWQGIFIIDEVGDAIRNGSSHMFVH